MIVLGPEELRAARTALDAAVVRAGRDRAVLRRGSSVIAVRELTRIWPACLEVLRRVPIDRSLGVVRSMLIDKPPAAGWSLPWHKDAFVAVQPWPGPMPPGFSKATMKRGVLHIEPPVDVLEAMVVVRVQLDDVTLDNGPLWLRPGSEQSGTRLDEEASEGVPVVGPAGSAVVYPFLTAHRSSTSSGTGRRRVLHFECAPATLATAAGFRWHRFDSLLEENTGGFRGGFSS